MSTGSPDFEVIGGNSSPMTVRVLIELEDWVYLIY